MTDKLVPDQLEKLLGNIPDDGNDKFKHRQRLHQGWWRAMVLGEECGRHPTQSTATICSTIEDDARLGNNFLTENIKRAVFETLEERKKRGKHGTSGLVEEGRLFNNLLSSQPLCFNFFGELATDPPLAIEILRGWIPQISKVTDVKFEFAPEENYTGDNSAFDVAIEFETTEGAKGIWGIECKYTDTFSSEPYNKQAYKDIYDVNRSLFVAEYEDCITPQYNQLFRNHLIALALSQNKKFDIAFSGLFCHQDDEKAIKTGKEFQKFFVDGEKSFKIVTYADYISTIQRLPEITWGQREWSMLLWARYCANRLSDVIAR